MSSMVAVHRVAIGAIDAQVGPRRDHERQEAHPPAQVGPHLQQPPERQEADLLVLAGVQAIHANDGPRLAAVGGQSRVGSRRPRACASCAAARAARHWPDRRARTTCAHRASAPRPSRCRPGRRGTRRSTPGNCARPCASAARRRRRPACPSGSSAAMRSGIRRSTGGSGNGMCVKCRIGVSGNVPRSRPGSGYRW